MKEQLKTLPIVENWDCHGCCSCCRTMTILLDKDDRARLRAQRWTQHPGFRGTRIVARETLLGGKYVLARKTDGSCVFLSDTGRCRIHEIHGAAAKPAVCRMFPFQLVPLESFSYVTLRRACPSAAADQGRPLREHLGALKRSGLVERFAKTAPRPPRIVPGVRRSWREFGTVTDAAMRLTTDDRLPLVRRLVHGLRFCSLLSECKLGRVDSGSFDELISLLETSAAEGISTLFQDRQPPSAATMFLFRQTAVHYIRSHPGFPVANRWRDRWKLLRISARVARGKGEFPPIHPGFPQASFAELERPLGPLSPEITAPLQLFFETHAMSRYYAIVGHRRPFVASYRALVLNYPMACWLLRLATGDREPAVADVVDLVVALDSGHGSAAIVRGSDLMASGQQLERLVAWYAR